VCVLELKNYAQPKQSSPIKNGPMCKKCGQKVESSDRLLAGGVLFHILCFKCLQCTNELGKLLCHSGWQVPMQESFAGQPFGGCTGIATINLCVLCFVCFSVYIEIFVFLFFFFLFLCYVKWLLCLWFIFIFIFLFLLFIFYLVFFCKKKNFVFS